MTGRKRKEERSQRPSAQVDKTIYKLKDLLSSNLEEERIIAVFVAGATGCRDFVSILGRSHLCKVLYNPSDTDLDENVIELSMVALGNWKDGRISEIIDNHGDDYGFLDSFGYCIVPNAISYPENCKISPFSFFMLFSLIRSGKNSLLVSKPSFIKQFKNYVNDQIGYDPLIDYYHTFVHKRMPAMKPYMNYLMAWINTLFESAEVQSLRNDSPISMSCLEPSNFLMTSNALLKAIKGDFSEREKALEVTISSIKSGRPVYAETLVNLCLLFPKLWGTAKATHTRRSTVRIQSL